MLIYLYVIEICNSYSCLIQIFLILQINSWSCVGECLRGYMANLHACLRLTKSTNQRMYFDEATTQHDTTNNITVSYIASDLADVTTHAAMSGVTTKLS